MKPIIIGLGNELFGDDGFGLLAARRLAGIIGDDADVIESGAAGLALLDPLVGRPRAVIIDAVCTGRNEPGTVYRIVPGELRAIPNLSPHYVGLPEVIRMARQLQLSVPETIDIVTVEAEDVTTMGARLSPKVTAALKPVVAMTIDILFGWLPDNGFVAVETSCSAAAAGAET